MACWWPDTSTNPSGVARQPDFLGENLLSNWYFPSIHPHPDHSFRVLKPGLFISTSLKFCKCSECPFLQCQISMQKRPCPRAPKSLCSPFQAERLSLAFLEHRVYATCPASSPDSLGIHDNSFLHSVATECPGSRHLPRAGDSAVNKKRWVFRSS